MHKSWRSGSLHNPEKSWLNIFCPWVLVCAEARDGTTRILKGLPVEASPGSWVSLFLTGLCQIFVHLYANCKASAFVWMYGCNWRNIAVEKTERGQKPLGSHRLMLEESFSYLTVYLLDFPFIFPSCCVHIRMFWNFMFSEGFRKNGLLGGHLVPLWSGN